jgi:hypothetical protein
VTGPQLSLTVTVFVPTGGASLAHCTLVDEHVIAGGSVSLTVTVNEQLLVLPHTSVAVQVTAFVPFGKKVEPLAGLQLVVTLVQLSLAVAVYVTLLFVHKLASVLVTMLLGHVIAGGVVSTVQLIVLVQNAVVKHSSVAV